MKNLSTSFKHLDLNTLYRTFSQFRSEIFYGRMHFYFNKSYPLLFELQQTLNRICQQKKI